MTNLRKAAEKIVRQYCGYGFSAALSPEAEQGIAELESILQSVAEEAVKEARHKWMAKADPFVQECMILAEDTGRSAGKAEGDE